MARESQLPQKTSKQQTNFHLSGSLWIRRLLEKIIGDSKELALQEKVLPYKSFPKFPHLAKKDAAIWEKFIARYPDKFHTCAYDIPIGHGVLSPLTERILSLDFQHLTKLRCDVLGFYGDDSFQLLEIKERANVESFGQCIAYREIIAKSIGIPKDIPTGIVCLSAHPDLIPLFEMYRIEVIQLD